MNPGRDNDLEKKIGSIDMRELICVDLLTLLRASVCRHLTFHHHLAVNPGLDVVFLFCVSALSMYIPMLRQSC